MDKKLIPLNGKGNPNLIREGLRELKENLQVHIEFSQVVAKVTRAKFEALVAEGFTEAQALELCRTI